MKQQHSLQFTDPAAGGAAQQYMSHHVLLRVDGCWELAVWSHETSCIHLPPPQKNLVSRVEQQLAFLFYNLLHRR